MGSKPGFLLLGYRYCGGGKLEWRRKDSLRAISHLELLLVPGFDMRSTIMLGNARGIPQIRVITFAPPPPSLSICGCVETFNEKALHSAIISLCWNEIVQYCAAPVKHPQG